MFLIFVCLFTLRVIILFVQLSASLRLMNGDLVVVVVVASVFTMRSQKGGNSTLA